MVDVLSGTADRQFWRQSRRPTLALCGLSSDGAGFEEGCAECVAS